MKFSKKTILLGGLVFILLLLGISAVLYADFKMQTDKSHTHVNVSYYGIHELKCPDCKSTTDLEIVGHETQNDAPFDSKETITLVYCHNCSKEFKAK